MSQKNRLQSGGRIDRSKACSFTYNGRKYSGFVGDTVASALLANGVDIVGRSFKYSVITSYSIHYTKLYDSNARSEKAAVIK